MLAIAKPRVNLTGFVLLKKDSRCGDSEGKWKSPKHSSISNEG